MSLSVLLLAGDFASTFGYHLPQHIWGRLHLRTHHDKTRSYWDHAIVSRDPGRQRRLQRLRAMRATRGARRVSL